MSDFDKSPKKKVMAAEIRSLRQELTALKERAAGDGPLNPRCSEAARIDALKATVMDAHEPRLDSHAAKLAVLENRIDVVATTALHLHENLLNEHEDRLKGLEEMALGNRKKAPIKKASKGRPT